MKGGTVPADVFDATVVADLTGDPRDAAFGPQLVSRFRRLMPERVRRICAALAGDDVEEQLDAVLSLKVSSSTVGAGELCELASRIEQHLRRGELALALDVSAQLSDAADRADRAFAAYLAA